MDKYYSASNKNDIMKRRIMFVCKKIAIKVHSNKLKNNIKNNNKIKIMNFLKKKIHDAGISDVFLSSIMPLPSKIIERY